MRIVEYDAENLPNEISLPLSQLLAAVIRDGGSMGFLANAMDADTYIAAGILTRKIKYVDTF